MKVVYNRRYGGFSLSAEAREWLIARRWRYADKLSEPRYGMVLVGDVPRHDPLLVECVETLGARAGGECAALAIETVERAYEITEYDGNETVHERYVSGYTEEDVAQRVADAVATARAEGAAAEREACLSWIEKVSLTVAKSGPMNAALAHIVATMRAMRDDLREHRARDTTPATLSTDTLAAIAETRGLRVVEPELVADVPVLRWECDLHSIARFGQWVLEADAEAWAVWVDSPGPAARLLVAEATTERTERAVNRSAAEDALRKLGVAFRTE